MKATSRIEPLSRRGSIKIEQSHKCFCCKPVSSQVQLDAMPYGTKLLGYYTYYDSIVWVTPKQDCTSCNGSGIKAPKNPFPLVVRPELLESIEEGRVSFLIVRIGDPLNDIESEWFEHDGIRVVGTNVKMLCAQQPINCRLSDAIRTREHKLGYFVNGTISASCDHPEMSGYRSIFDPERWVYSEFAPCLNENMGNLFPKMSLNDRVYLISVYPLQKRKEYAPPLISGLMR